MLNFKKEKVNIDDKLKQRIDFICRFCGFKPTFESGNIISLDKTNLYYIEPNKAIIKDILILFFNHSNEVYINNLNNKVLLKDLEVIDNINLKLATVIKEYKSLMRKVKKCEISYMKHNVVLYELLQKITRVEDEFDRAIKSLGSIYDDEMRAREQLKELTLLLKECNDKVRKHHLPIILDNYFIELTDAKEAILEIEKELDKKPIVIKVLNIRVDTARDLVFKFYTTTDEMIRNAYFTELLLVYANRYRSDTEIDRGLSKTEMLYFRGEYEESFNLVLKVLETKEKGVTKRILDLCQK